MSETLPVGDVNFSGYWRQVKNEGFDGYMKVLGLPWVIRKLAKRVASGSTDIIWQRGKQMRVATVNSKGAWTRMYCEGKQVYQKNAAGEPVRIKTWWEGKVHKCQSVGSSFGVMESWRYMEDRLMVVKSRVVAPDGRIGEVFWFFEGLPHPHRLQPGSTQSTMLKNVWRDQSKVEKATRKDNLHLQVLLHDLSRWETPADNYFHMFTAVSDKARARGSRPNSPASSQRSRPRPQLHSPNNTAQVTTLSVSSSQVELAQTPASVAVSGGGGATQVLVVEGRGALPPRHRRVLSDPGSALSVETPSCSDLSAVDATAASVSAMVSEPAAGGMPASDAGAAPEVLSPVPAGESAASDAQVLMSGNAEDSGPRLEPETTAAARVGVCLEAVPIAEGQGSDGPDSGGIGSPTSVKSADAMSGRTAVSGTIRATPRSTPMPSMDQADLEKVLAWKIHEFKDVRGIANVVPVKTPGEPELLEMSPEQAEQTYAKLQELEELARLHRQQQGRSFNCFCCVVSLHDHLVPDYLKSWEM